MCAVSDEAVAEAAASLYAVPLAEFVACRKSLAGSVKAGGDAAGAKEILALRKPTVTAWAMNVASREDSGAIGKRYRRQDEIGTPFCITVDFDTLEDQAVTIRERDTMAQERVTLEQVEGYLAQRLLGC